MARRRPSSAPLGTTGRFSFAPRTFEDSIDALTQESIAESLGRIEQVLQERYGVKPEPAPTPKPARRRGNG
jgi:hypothetical protein